MCVAIAPRGRTPQFHVDKWQLLFKGSVYSRAASIYFPKRIFVASIRGWLLFKGGFYSRKYGSLPFIIFTVSFLLILFLYLFCSVSFVKVYILCSPFTPLF